MKEEWRIIDRFPRYAVSNGGRVKNIISGAVLSQRKSSNGYLRVNLRTGAVKYENPHTEHVHRLVAESFLPIEPDKPFVNHKDGNKHNNSVDNLEWCTASDNITHAYRMGLELPRKCPQSEKARAINIASHNTEKYRENARRANKLAGITQDVEQIDIKSGKVIATHDNCTVAAVYMFGEKYSTQDRLIARCARTCSGTAYGYIWRYKRG